MNGNKSTYKYHPYITNIFCSGGASSYKTEAFFVSLPFRKVVSISGKYLSDALKMCADYLDIQIIRLLSLSLSHGYARQYTKYSLNTNHLRRVRFPEYLSFPRYYPNLYMPPSPIGGAYRHIRRRCMPEHGTTMPAYAADMLFLLTRNNKSYQI